MPQSTGTTTSALPESPGTLPAPGDSPRAAAEIVEAMSVDEQAGQLVMTALQGTQSVTKEVRATLTKSHIGGVILFDFNVTSHTQVKQFTAALQAVAKRSNSGKVGLLISIDQEGGAHRHIAGVPPEHTAAELGAGSEKVTVAEYRSAGAQLKQLGINMNLAPVADLDAGSARVMRGRAFSADAALAALHVGLAVRGTQDAGILATVKHFPGLGRSTANSDFGAARVVASETQMRETDLGAFQAAIDTKVGAVMMSHALYTGWGMSGVSGTIPASLNQKFMQQILREEFGYQGIIITDSLNAKGLRDSVDGTVPQFCERAIEAGADIALVTGSLETAKLCQRRIAAAARSSSEMGALVRDAAERIVSVKLSF